MGKVTRVTTDIGAKLQAALDIQNYSTQVGWFEGAKYEDGTPVAYVAAIQEFGYAPKNIPPRSFIRTTIKEKKSEWKGVIKSGAKTLVAGNISPEDLMATIGLMVAGDIKEKIIKIQKPKLKPATIASRQRKLADGKTVGSLTKPLVETGLMLTSLTSVAVKK